MCAWLDTHASHTHTTDCWGASWKCEYYWGIYRVLCIDRDADGNEMPPSIAISLNARLNWKANGSHFKCQCFDEWPEWPEWSPLSNGFLWSDIFSLSLLCYASSSLSMKKNLEFDGAWSDDGVARGHCAMCAPHNFRLHSNRWAKINIPGIKNRNARQFSLRQHSFTMSLCGDESFPF